jgi:hypothetical protein
MLANDCPYLNTQPIAPGSPLLTRSLTLYLACGEGLRLRAMLTWTN